MSGIDNRIVTMKFDNAQFEANARTSLTTMQKIKESMNFGSVGAAATKAMTGVSSIFSKFGIKNPFATATAGASDLTRATQSVGTTGLSSLDGAVTGISRSFIAMSTVAITALSNIVTSAQQSGTAMVKALTVDPVKTGLDEYETNLNSIQTILANTKVSGADLNDVNKALTELNEYSDKTIYNFATMAKNIGTFTAAGVGLDESVMSIKGIANLAALSGSSSEQAGTAMYQLSQEIAAGRVSLMGWNSVVNAGMGGSTFQRALANTAVAMGEIDESALKLEGEMKNVVINGSSFRDSIMAKPGEVSWLTKDVLTGTLAQFTGDLKKADIMAQGFNENQAESIMATARTAMSAAQDVKTLSGVFDVAKETAASGWSRTMQLIFGDFEEAKTLFTSFSESFSGGIARMAEKRNDLLEGWQELGGRDVLIESMKDLWNSISSILNPIKKAFREIFPATTSKELFALTEKFQEFAQNLKISKDTAAGLKDTFAGVFAIFSIIGQVISAIAGGIGDLLGAIGEGSGGFLDFTGGLGNAVVAFDQFLEKSGILETFFGSIAGLLSVPIRLLSSFAEVLGTMFSSFDIGGAGGAVGAMDKFGDSAEGLATGGERIMSVFEGLGKIVGNVADYIVNALSKLGTAIGGAITPEMFSASLDAINTALLGGIVLMLRKFFSGGLNVDVGGGFFNTVKESLGAATGVLQNMQANLKADILLKIAGALGVMALSLLLLSSIDSGSLTKALTAMAIGFGLLGGVMVALITYIGPVGAMKLPLISAAMIGLATAMLIFAGALKIIGSMHPLDVAQGLIAVGLALGIFSVAANAISKNPAGMIRAAVAIGILAVALNLLGVAMKIFATMSWEEMAKGIVGVVGSLTAIAIAMQLMPKGIVLQAAGILILSVALNALGLALKVFATLDWAQMAKGLVGVVGSLTAIAIAMRLMPKGMVLQAAALVLVAGALTVLAGALKIMGGMSWEEIGKGLVTLGGALLILAIGLNMMGLMGVAGAVALGLATAALILLTPVLITLGSLSWETIIKSLTMLAGVFVILGLAGLILAPVVPVILGLAVAMTLIGAGLALAGVGALAFATAFSVIVGMGVAAVSVLGALLGTIVAAIPGFFAALGQGLGRMASAIAKNGPQFTRAMSTILGSMLDSVIKNVPKMGRAFLVMLTTALRVIVTATPRIVAAGYQLIVNFLRAIEQNIGKIINIAAQIIVNFINGIARNIGKIIDSGVKLIIKFIEGVTKALNNNSEKLGEAGGDLAIAIVEGMANGISAAAGQIKDAAINAAKDALQGAKDWLLSKSPSKRARDELGKPISQGMAIGIAEEAYLAEDAAVGMGKTAVSALKSTMDGLSDVLDLDPNMHPVVSPVLDLTALSQEANKMSSILATVPIMAGVSYQTASDISAMTQASSDAGDGTDGADGGGGGDQYVTLEQHLHSPKPIDSVESYRAGKTLISLAKEALK